MNMKYAILTHGGAASPHAYSDGCVKAAEAARAVLEQGGDAAAAALAATVVLEDDPRFNAGTGSNLRFDGQTIEMDASIMTSDARFGSVACIQRVKNPILVAAKVMETPHLMLVGDGATAFARATGFGDYDPMTEKAKDKHARAMAELRGQGDGDYATDAAAWLHLDWRALWNFGSEPPIKDTVGAVVLQLADGVGRARLRCRPSVARRRGHDLHHRRAGARVPCRSRSSESSPRGTRPASPSRS